MGSVTAADPIPRAAGSGRPAANQSVRSAMRIVRPQPAGLRCRVRLADGRVFTGALPPARHRAIQLGMLHSETAELVDIRPAASAPGPRRAGAVTAGSAVRAARSTTSPQC
jgi:hypothetical protein